MGMLRAKHPAAFSMEPEDVERREAARQQREAELELEMRAQKRYDRRRRLDSFKLPLTAKDADLLLADALDMHLKSIVAVSSWLASNVPWILLLGSTGRGKTLAAAWALMQHGGRYVGARELERLATARYGDEAETFTELLATRTLVVDDIGRERDVGHMTAVLLDLVDERRKRGQKTIAISNVAKAAFLKTYADERLLSRLSEPGIASWVSDAGTDLRRAK
ncbi:MAG TPA: ATP-binding protein [Polyangiales bacterium]|nr:ATP-binding protein [Polyangiales bacterium]